MTEMIKSEVDFKVPSYEEWKNQIIKDLKGKPFESLIKTDRNGLRIEAPIHDYDAVDGKPGAAPYIRGNKPERLPFISRLDFSKSTWNNADVLATLNFNPGSIRVNSSTPVEGIDFSILQVDFNGSIDKLKAFVSGKTFGGFSFNYDPILASNGDSAELKAYVKTVLTTLPHSEHKVATINAAQIANAGGNQLDELTYACGAGHELLLALLNAGLSIDDASARIAFNFGTGPEFIQEASKIRAFRRLWATIISAYNPEHDCSHNAYVTSETIRWNKPAIDEETNILRSTTEAMAAIIGGVDVMQVNAENLSKNSQSFNARIALNILNLLREESYFELSADPAGGSYSVESLTSQLTEKAWDIFKSNESQGGFLNGYNAFVALVKQHQLQLKKEIEEGSRTVLGANLYPKEGDTFTIEQLQFESL